MEKHKKIFIDKNIEVFENDIAEKKLVEKNDLKYFRENIGVSKVDISRWKEAQEYENKTWCISGGKHMVTDRNEDHAKNFDNYSFLNNYLQGKELNLIELGCGPFTNVRIILNKLRNKINLVDLVDPLILNYTLHTTNCTYKNGLLNFNPVNMFNLPIEEFSSSVRYDLVVMINVLEHCYDTDIIFHKIKNMMNENSIFLLADRFICDEDLDPNSFNDFYDAGHPIRISKRYIDDIINENFKIIFNNSYNDNHFIAKNNMYLGLMLK